MGIDHGEPRPGLSVSFYRQFAAAAWTSSLRRNASTGRAMFFKSSAPSSSKVIFSRSCTWSRPARVRMQRADIPPEVSLLHSLHHHASQSHRRSRPQCLCRRGSGWPGRQAGRHQSRALCAFAPHRAVLSNTISSKSPPVWTILPPCSSMAGSITSLRSVHRLCKVPASSDRSNGCNRPCRHRRRRLASADLANVRSGLMHCSPT